MFFKDVLFGEWLGINNTSFPGPSSVVQKETTLTLCHIITEHCCAAADSHVSENKGEGEREKEKEMRKVESKQTSIQIMTVYFKDIFYWR